MKSFVLTILVSMFATGCRTQYWLPVSQEMFEEGPVIIQRLQRYYLRYRLKLHPDSHNLKVVLMREENKKKGEAYFWLSCPTSWPAYGSTIEFPLEYEGYSKYAKLGKIFWINSDGTKLKIPVITDPTERIKVNIWSHQK